ncbi:MAG: hypothetical protein A2Y80_02090 [Deltaproteobacteria bacterium RBG_13_58_19]|nr:MAG: hypothetical protein A2Y80_02090 [Deltaproteobacteria bacterium RBG_13_58_19]
MIFDEFLLDPEGHTKDLINLLVTQGKKEDLEKAARLLGVDINTIRQWGYRTKDNDHAYLWRAIILSVCMKNDRILREWAEMFKQEVHPRGTGKELERLRQIKEILE